jgi:hypothetical protein
MIPRLDADETFADRGWDHDVLFHAEFAHLNSINGDRVRRSEAAKVKRPRDDNCRGSRWIGHLGGRADDTLGAAGEEQPESEQLPGNPEPLT